jgi:hypothetical protein
MKSMTSICMALLFSIAVYGQSSAAPQGTSSDSEQPDTSGRRLKQLYKTIDDLVRAGKWEEAWKVNRQADRERCALWDKLETLHDETIMIRLALRPFKTTILHVQISEVSPAKLRKAGYDTTKFLGVPKAETKNDTSSKTDPMFWGIQKESELKEWVNRFREQKLLMVLLEPTLCTYHSCARIVVGGDMVDQIYVVPPGLKRPSPRIRSLREPAVALEFLAEVMGDKIRLTCRGRLAKDEKYPVNIDKESTPDRSAGEFDFSHLEIKDGQVLAINIPMRIRVEVTESASDDPIPQKDIKTELSAEESEVVTIIIVRPEIIEWDDGAASAAKGSQGGIPRQ